MKLVEPEVYLVGYTMINFEGFKEYLKAEGAEDFLESVHQAEKEGLSDGEIICSTFAKLCYKSLVLGKNANISRTRDIPDNIKGCFDQGHGSVFEHCQLNFIIRNCSRVFTHELVRHRVGTAFSQTSGRYVRGDSVDLVFDPILNPVRETLEDTMRLIEQSYQKMVKMMDLDNMKDFTLKKKITSALRRILPNGQSNEIAFSVNLRALRHLVQLRTSRAAEWEIRLVFNKIYQFVKEKFPLIFYGAKEELVDGLIEVSEMKMNPYERQ